MTERTLLEDEASGIAAADARAELQAQHVDDPRKVYVNIARRYSYAVPTEAALQAVVTLGLPVLEVGAGLGYWTWELRRRGVDCLATSPEDTHERPWVFVRHVKGTTCASHPRRALLMVWPTNPKEQELGGSWAAKAVRVYKGAAVIYVGDPEFRVCAGPSLPKALENGGFTLDVEASLHSWDPSLNMPDVLRIYRRSLTRWSRPCTKEQGRKGLT